MNCPNCNNPLKPNQKLCDVCGSVIDESLWRKDKKSSAEPFRNTSLEYNDDYESSEVNTLDPGVSPERNAPQPAEYYPLPPQPPQPMPAYRQPAPQPRDSTRTMLMVVIILLAVLIIGGSIFAAILLVNNNKKSNDEGQPSSSAQSSVSSRSESSKDSSREKSSKYSSREESSDFSSREESSRFSSREESSRYISFNYDGGITLYEAFENVDELQDSFSKNLANNDEDIDPNDRVVLEGIFYSQKGEYTTTCYIAFAYHNVSQNYYNVLYALTSDFNSDGTMNNSVGAMLSAGPAKTLSAAVENCWFLSSDLGISFETTQIL